MSRIAIAMSGGVDSSTAALLLKNQAHEVFGVFFVLTAAQNPAEAQAAADFLHIKLHILDLQSEFNELVAADFTASYEAGRTPNPCVRCNKLIKFGAVLERALGLGADFFATGHYARVERDQSGAYHLFKPKDLNKDQTYFLYGLNQRQLAHSLFPLAELTKPQVRQIAAEHGLPAAPTPASTDACFLNGQKLENYLADKISSRGGNIRDIESGRIMAQHQGVHKYTIGQRQGLGLPAGPWYVCGLDIQTNEVLITTNPARLEQSQIVLNQVNWISGREPVGPLKIQCKIRYGASAEPAVAKQHGDDYFVKFSKPQRAAAPGQSAVFYDQDECLGGGIIQKT